MKTTAYRKIDIVVLAGLSAVALVILTLGATLVNAQASAPAGLGSGWTCHKLPYVEICDRAV